MVLTELGSIYDVMRKPSFTWGETLQCDVSRPCSVGKSDKLNYSLGWISPWDLMRKE